MQKYILNFFASVAAADEQVEVIREVICERCNYNIFLLFQQIDQENKGYFDYKNIEYILRNPNISEHEIRDIIRE